MKRIVVLAALLFFLLGSCNQSRDIHDVLKLDSILKKDLQMYSSEAGLWYYYTDNKNPGSGIRKIDKPIVSRVTPQFAFYDVRLGNRMGEDVSGANCLVVLNTTNSKILVIPPMWYSGINSPFLKLFIGKKFDSEDKLMSFLSELIDLLNIGTDGEFAYNSYKKDKVLYGYYTNFRGKPLQLWSYIEVGISDNTIKYFKSTNPAMHTSEIVQ